MAWDDTGDREGGETFLTGEQMTKCHAVIHTASTAAGAAGTGLAQLPCSDNAVIVPIQIGMVISLGAVFGIRMSESAAASTLAASSATLVGRGISQWLVGWIPVIGNITNAVTAAAVTEAIGWAVAASFDNSGRKQRGKREH